MNEVTSVPHTSTPPSPPPGAVVQDRAQLTLIQGPPGTGKTTTAVAIICEWLLRSTPPLPPAGRSQRPAARRCHSPLPSMRCSDLGGGGRLACPLLKGVWFYSSVFVWNISIILNFYFSPYIRIGARAPVNGTHRRCKLSATRPVIIPRPSRLPLNSPVGSKCVPVGGSARHPGGGTPCAPVSIADLRSRSVPWCRYRGNILPRAGPGRDPRPPPRWGRADHTPPPPPWGLGSLAMMLAVSPDRTRRRESTPHPPVSKLPPPLG